MKRVLIAGIGNIFFGDDGFGVEVATRLGSRTLPPGVVSADLGIRGVHLAYELLDGYDGLVLVDALDLGETPGTVAVVEPERADGLAGGPVDAHGLHPQAVLSAVETLGGRIGQVRIVGCQPATAEEGMGLSPAVAAAVDAAADEAVQVATEMLNNQSMEVW